MLLVGPSVLKEKKKKKDETEVPASVAKNVSSILVPITLHGQRSGEREPQAERDSCMLLEEART